jgi:hypothetical protein
VARLSWTFLSVAGPLWTIGRHSLIMSHKLEMNSRERGELGCGLVYRSELETCFILHLLDLHGS